MAVEPIGKEIARRVRALAEALAGSDAEQAMEGLHEVEGLARRGEEEASRQGRAAGSPPNADEDRANAVGGIERHMPPGWSAPASDGFTLAPGEAEASPNSPVATQQMALAMHARISRLNQFATWIEDDPAIVTLIDETISSRVRAAAHRQAIISVLVAILSLIVGWLLNAINPVSLASVFHF